MITPLHIDQVCSGSEYWTLIFTVSITKQITLGKRFTIVTTTLIADSVAVYLSTKRLVQPQKNELSLFILFCLYVQEILEQLIPSSIIVLHV